MFFSLAPIVALAASVVALPNLAARAAPEVTYPHAGITWQDTWWHNVTWAPSTGTATIYIIQGGNKQAIANNVDLSSGRTVVQVPAGLQAGTATVEIDTDGQSSTSNEFNIGPHEHSAGAASTATAVLSSVVSSASALPSGVASASASAFSSAASVISSAVSAASSEIAASGSGAASASASATSAIASLGSSAAAASSSVASALSAGSASITSALASATAPKSSTSASATSGSSGAANLGVSKMGVALAAGLVAITTLSGALVF